MFFAKRWKGENDFSFAWYGCFGSKNSLAYSKLAFGSAAAPATEHVMCIA